MAICISTGQPDPLKRKETMDEEKKPVVVFAGHKKDWVDYTIDFLTIGATLTMIAYFVYHAWTIYRLKS